MINKMFPIVMAAPDKQIPNQNKSPERGGSLGRQRPRGVLATLSKLLNPVFSLQKRSFSPESSRTTPPNHQQLLLTRGPLLPWPLFIRPILHGVSYSYGRMRRYGKSLDFQESYTLLSSSWDFQESYTLLGKSPKPQTTDRFGLNVIVTASKSNNAE